MMITNKERRKVAASMRNTSMMFDFCAHNIAMDMGIDDDYNYDEGYNVRHKIAWLTLADLIEPDQERTCHNEASGDIPPLFYCSECGADFLNEPINGEWNYCPNCGARVVSSNE